MGLNIHLEQDRRYLNVDEEIDSRLNIASQVLTYYRSRFTPKILTIWKSAPLQSLGGTMLKQIPFALDEDLPYVRQYLRAFTGQEKPELILVFTGDWVIGENRIEGFLNVYGKTKLGSIYGDIELNIYPTERFADLVHLIKTDADLERTLVHDFFTQFNTMIQNEPFKARVMYFGIGVPSMYDVNAVTAVYYRSEKNLWTDCLRTNIREQHTVEDSFKPYKETFLISGLKQVPAFTSFIDELLDRHHVVRETSGSLILTGQNLDSFRNFYEELSTTILQPVAKELPDKDNLLNKIKSVVESKVLKQTRL